MCKTEIVSKINADNNLRETNIMVSNKMNLNASISQRT